MGGRPLNLGLFSITSGLRLGYCRPSSRPSSSIQNLKLAGALVGTVVLSLTTWLSGGSASTLSGLPGAGGLGLMIKERAEYLEEVYALKEHSLYLLCRLREAKKV